MSRWQQYGAEQRTNLIRIIAIFVFYSVELANFHGIKLGGIEWPKLDGLTSEFHSVVTALAVAWVSISLVIYMGLRRKIFPRWTMYASVTADLVLLTTVLITADGPGSPLVVLYYLILALAATRFSLHLIRYTTVSAGLCYLYLLGAVKWFGAGEPVPRYHQAIVLITIILTGVILGQVVRRARALSGEFAQRLGVAVADGGVRMPAGESREGAGQ